jgi:ribosomal protein L11 methyltransferase
MGCGTGILGILAGMRGAKSVHGIDVDTWCIDNTLENAERNGVPMSAALGGSEVLEDTYDLILANINLNVLLADLSHYVKALRSGGSIFFSGFYEDDVSTLRAAAEALGLNFEGVKAREQWRSIKMVK